MRVLLLKHCSNIRFFNTKETNGGQTEIMVTIDLLKKAGHNVTVLTLDRYRDDAPQGVDTLPWSKALMALPHHDAVFIFNGVFNCFGGVISDETLTCYRILNEFKGPIIYAVTDTAIAIGDCAGWIRGAQAKGKYPELDAKLYEFDPKRIYCLTQTHDLKVLPRIWEADNNGFGHYAYFPFETTVFFRKGLASSICEKPITDLIYFGNPRGGKRNKKFVKYYCGHPSDIRVDVYGNWTEAHITNLFKKDQGITRPNFLGKSDMYELHSKINYSYAHCYISDPQNENTIWTTRFYEAVLNRAVLFVDIANDPDMRRFKDPFFYVRDREELATKIRQLRTDQFFRAQKLTQQFESMSTILQTIPNYHTILDFNLKKAQEIYGKSIPGTEQ